MSKSKKQKYFVTQSHFCLFGVAQIYIVCSWLISVQIAETATEFLIRHWENETIQTKWQWKSSEIVDKSAVFHGDSYLCIWYESWYIDICLYMVYISHGLYDIYHTVV